MRLPKRMKRKRLRLRKRKRRRKRLSLRSILKKKTKLNKMSLKLSRIFLKL